MTEEESQMENSLFSSLDCGKADKRDQNQPRCSSESCVHCSCYGHVMSLELDKVVKRSPYKLDRKKNIFIKWA